MKKSAVSSHRPYSAFICRQASNSGRRDCSSSARSCSNGSAAMQTGLGTETVVVDTLPTIALPIECPDCGEVHFWKPTDAWLRQGERSQQHQKGQLFERDHLRRAAGRRRDCGGMRRRLLWHSVLNVVTSAGVPDRRPHTCSCRRFGADHRRGGGTGLMARMLVSVIVTPVVTAFLIIMAMIYGLIIPVPWRLGSPRVNQFIDKSSYFR